MSPTHACNRAHTPRASTRGSHGGSVQPWQSLRSRLAMHWQATTTALHCQATTTAYCIANLCGPSPTNHRTVVLQKTKGVVCRGWYTTRRLRQGQRQRDAVSCPTHAVLVGKSVAVLDGRALRGKGTVSTHQRKLLVGDCTVHVGLPHLRGTEPQVNANGHSSVVGTRATAHHSAVILREQSTIKAMVCAQLPWTDHCHGVLHGRRAPHYEHTCT